MRPAATSRQAIAGGERGARGRRAHARAHRVDGCRDLARRGDARRVPRHPRLRGRRAAAARGVPRDDPAPGRSGTTPCRRTPTPRGRRTATSIEALAAAHLEQYDGRHRLPRVQPHGRGARRGARRPRPRDGVDRARTAAPRRGSLGRHRHARGAHPARPPPGRRRRARVVARVDPSRGARASRRSGCCRSTGGSCSVVPAALLVATRAVQTSFLSWTHLAVVLGAWLVFVARGAAAASAGARRGR